jgi:class 3 adenylate cyclase/tetratricopeptide (TPR) repeat protein
VYVLAFSPVLVWGINKLPPNLLGERMKCPECQFDNREGAKFCKECGSKLELACPKCGSVASPGSKFCDECGHNLALPHEAHPKELSFDDKLEKIQRYLPKGLTEKILSQRDKIEGERKQVTVMFCDMEGFTSLSGSLGPEEAYSIMDQVYEILIHKVHDYEGTVNEMTGDGIMALFGAPIALEDAPQRAIRSALAIHREMAKFSHKIKQEREGIPPLKMRTGIHTGPVVVGTMGNDLRVEFKAVGDTVNLASRMEGLAQPGTTYVTEDTFRATEGFFRFEALGEREVKGKEEPVKTYHVIAPSTSRTRFDVSADRGLTPFVGRERELDLLLDGFDRAKGARGQAFSIMAEAGVGKSRLLYEFRKAVANEDVTFLEGKCLSYSRGVAYHLHIDTLKANFDIREGDGDSEIKEKVKRGLKIIRLDEASTLPYFLELLSVKESGIEEMSLSPEARKDRIIEALKVIVLKGSEIRPLILAYEDLHWVDNSSEEVLKNILESIPGARVLLIFTYRPEFAHTWGGKSYHSQVNLNRLSNRESLAMVAHLLGTEHIESGLEEFILEKTEGIPFFIEEFIKSLRDLQIIERKDNTYRISKDIQTVTIPATIQDVIMARVDSLPEVAKAVLQTGSVVGREFSHDLINRVMELPEQELLSHLSALKDSELLYERGIYPQSAYIFKHALTQDVTYNSLLLKRRKEIHEKIGIAIEEIYAEKLEEFYEILAYHYSKSEEYEKAFQYQKLSGEKATRNFSTWEGFQSYRDALKTFKQLEDTENNRRRKLEILKQMTGLIRILGHPEDSLSILREGEKLSKDLGDEKGHAIFRGRIGSYYNLKEGNPLLGIAYSEECFQEAEKTQDIELIASTGLDLCPLLMVLGEFSRAKDLSQKLILLLEETENKYESFGTGRNLYSTFNAFCGHAMGCLGDFKEGEVFFERGLQFASQINDKTSLGLIEWHYGAFFSYKGDGESAIKYINTSIKKIEEVKFVTLLGLGWCMLGLGYYFIGEFKTARKYIEKGLRIYREAEISFWTSYQYLALGLVHFGLGDLDNAQTCIEEALNLSHNHGEKSIEGRSRMWQGRVLGKAQPSQVSRAEEYIVHGMKLCEELKLRPFYAEGHFLLGELYADKGQSEKALENLKKAEGMFREMGMDYWLARTEEILRSL